MKKYDCPNCGKELIRLEPFEEDIYTYWCDDCNINITIEDNDKNWLERLKERNLAINLRDFLECDKSLENLEAIRANLRRIGYDITRTENDKNV